MRLMRTGCGKSSRDSCRGPQIPKRRRRSAVPANGGMEKARSSRAIPRIICAKPGGATLSERLRPRRQSGRRREWRRGIRGRPAA